VVLIALQHYIIIMKKIIRLTESDLTRLVKRIITESNDKGFGLRDDFSEYEDRAEQYYASTYKSGRGDDNPNRNLV
jgi:hypothetical protein